MKEIIEMMRLDLMKNGDVAHIAASQRFFKEEMKFYGLKSAALKKIEKEYYKGIKGLPKDEILALCEKLWQSGYMEESIIACNWSYRLAKKYTEDDFRVFESWLDNYVNNWASCDTLCNHSLGTFIEMYPSYIEGLRRFALSENRWKRRAAAVSLIIPARKGLFKMDILAIAEILLEDPDDMVQKGYGWMLKAASQSDEKMVFDFVTKHKARMPRTALRYAIEKMPGEKRAEAMKRP